MVQLNKAVSAACVDSTSEACLQNKTFSDSLTYRPLHCSGQTAPQRSHYYRTGNEPCRVEKGMLHILLGQLLICFCLFFG